MKRYIIRLLITAVTAYFLTRWLDSVNLGGVSFENFKIALLFAFVLSLLNIFVKPIIKLITLPVTIITLGLFSLVINVIVIYIADYFIDGMTLNGFVNVFIFSVLLSIANAILGKIFIKNKK